MSAATCVAPMGKKSERRDRIDLRCEPEMRDRIESQGERFGQGLSAYIRQAIIERLERDEASDPRAAEDEAPPPDTDDAAPKPKPRRKSD